MKLPKLAVKNYQFTALIFLLLLIMGINSYLNMPQTENPTVYIPGASVIVVYPGASPNDLEELVGKPIEEAINELDEIKKISTKLKDGIAVITVEFVYDTDPHDKYDEVVQKVNSIKSELPDDIFSLDFWKFSSSDVAMLQFAFVSETAPYHEMEQNADKLKKRIEQVQGVKKVEIVAYPEREVRVALDMQKMAEMNIGIEQVAQAIQSNNANIPGGSVNISGKNFGIKTSGSYSDLDEIRNTVVSSHQGRIIYLKHIARVAFDYEDQNYFAHFNGKRAIFMVVKQKEGVNIFEIVEEIQPRVQKFSSELPPDIALHKVFEQSKIIENRISGFMNNLFQGIVIVGLVILLALGFRSAVLVIIAIPLSIAIGLSFVDMAGLGLQQITIAALVVALGLLVDNSIVMVENINRFLALGYSPPQAAVKGASQIGYAIGSATLTTLLAFVPIIMMPDKAGDFIRGLPVTITATLSISLLIALTLTPLIASRFFKGFASRQEYEKKQEKKYFEKFLRRLIEGPYRQTLDFALRRPALVIVAAAFILGFSLLFAVFFVGKSFFPKSETPQFMVRVNMPEGTSLAQTDSVARHVEGVLAKTPLVKHYATNVGHGNPRIYYNILSKNYAKNFAEIYVETHRYEVEQFDSLITSLRQKLSGYPGSRIEVKEFEQGIPTDATIMIYIMGKELDVLKKIAAEVETDLKKSAGAINIENQLSKRRTDLFFKINKDKAGMFGVPLYEIDKTIRTAVNGAAISKFRDSEGKDYDIVLRLPQGENIGIEHFDQIYVKSLAGKFIPIRQLATIEFKEAPGIVTRYNLSRTAIITADLEKGFTLDEVMNPVIEKLDHYDFPPGYSYRVGGELEARNETFGGMENAGIIALIAIFSVLVLQFRSFVQPLIIFTAIPLAVIGSVWALFFAGYTFSFTAFVGLISLIGIVINNSIILVDYTNQLIREGKTIAEALKIAGETRFTPIILTTLTTVGGLLPLTLRGGSMWAPMGWTIIGGLLVSTVLTLIIVPVLYKILTKAVQKTANAAQTEQE